MVFIGSELSRMDTNLNTLGRVAVGHVPRRVLLDISRKFLTINEGSKSGCKLQMELGEKKSWADNFADFSFFCEKTRN